MTFKRPRDIKLTEMAQWVDTNAYLEDRDNDKFVEYLYHIAYMKAERSNLFSDYTQYDDFALFCVSKFFIRYSNKSESPVKSVINYFKTVRDYWRAEYIREFCCGDADLNVADFNLGDFSDYLIDASSEYDTTSYSLLCFRAADIIKKYLLKIPRKKNSSEWSNIYTSCLLTLENRIKVAADLCRNLDINKDAQQVNRIVRNLKKLPPVLYHLSESYSTYISVLVNESIHALASELTTEIHHNVSVSNCLRNLVTAAYNCEDNN